MGRPGFEPATPGFTGQCANHYAMETELLREVKFLKYKVFDLAHVQISAMGREATHS